MVHAIIYDNIPGIGWDLYGRTRNFPTAYEAEIQHVGEYFRAGNGNIESTAIRYAPLQDKYLLSWVVRHPVTGIGDSRAYYSVVNFLMDAEDADQMFRIPFVHAHEKIEDIARELWESKLMELPNRWWLEDAAVQKQEKREELYDVPRTVMLACGLYSGRKKYPQIYLEARDPWLEINWLQTFTPFSLRKQLSFCVGLEKLQESKNVILNFVTNISLNQLRNDSNTDGAPMSTKYWGSEGFQDYDMMAECERILRTTDKLPKPIKLLLKHAVDDWYAYEKLAEKDKLIPALQCLLSGIKESRWISALNKVKMDRESLEMLEKAIPKRCDYQKLKKEIKERLKQLSSQHRRHSQGRRTAYTREQEENEYPPKDEKRVDAEEDEEQKENQVQWSGIKQLLLKQVKRTGCIAALVIALIAFITFVRQTMLYESGVTGQIIWVSVNQRAALDVSKLLGTFLSGIVVGVAGIGLLGNRKK